MRKLMMALVLLVSVGTVASAQKIGYIRVDDIVGLMPEVQKVNLDTIGQKFIQDSVLSRYDYVQSELNRKLQEFNDTTKPQSIRQEIYKDIQNFQAELDGAQQVIAQVQQYKQQEFLQPYYAKAKKAIDDVAKAKGYAYVLSKDVFVTAPEADDLTMAVLAKLNIQLPKQQPAAAPKPKTN